MGVYVKGMEMPNNCCECRLLSGFECRALFKDITDFPVADECPLAPVPPHGRLIDADALCSHIKDEQKKCNDPYDGWSECQVALGFVNTAPTIIPAEEGER